MNMIMKNDLIVNDSYTIGLNEVYFSHKMKVISLDVGPLKVWT
jgi:hypothetical protein